MQLAYSKPSPMTRALQMAMLLFTGAGVLFPLMLFFLNALKSNADFLAHPLALPETWRFDNFVEAWDRANLGRLMLNSFVVSAGASVLAIVLSSTFAYGIYRHRFRGSRVIFISMVMMLTIPAQLYIIPLFIIVVTIGLANNLLALILVYAAGSMPLSVVLFKNYFDDVPVELIEAATVDGSSSFNTFVRIVMPLSLPVTAAVAIFSFVSAWNEFFLALVFIQDKDLYTLPLGTQAFTISQYSTDFPLLFSAFTISILPMVVVYLFMQRQFISGLTGGALKG